MIKFYPSVLKGSIDAPPSKSCGIRMLCAAALASTPTTIENLPECTDIRTAIACLQSLGCKVQVKGTNRLTVKIDPFSKITTLATAELNFQQSATTARFLTVICSAYGIPANCRAEGTLLRRSQVSMTGRMALRGANFSSFSYPLRLSGRLTGGTFSLPGNEGAQFLCALLMVLPVLRDDSDIVLTTPLLDPEDVDMTLDLIARFGIKVSKTDQGYHIPGHQYYNSPGKLICENDWSLASLWTAAGAACSRMGGHVEVCDLDPQSRQAYRDVHTLFPLISQDFEEFYADASEFPNIATFLAALASAVQGRVTITGIEQLQHRETNRLKSIAQCLEKVECSCEMLGNDGFIFNAKKRGPYPIDFVVDTMGDPWLFMSLALSSVLRSEPLALKDEHGADKIYAGFLKDFATLGGYYEIFK